MTLLSDSRVCEVCGAPYRQRPELDLVFCEFCGLCICTDCDRPTDFGHTCPECSAKVATGQIDRHGVEHE